MSRPTASYIKETKYRMTETCLKNLRKIMNKWYHLDAWQFFIHDAVKVQANGLFDSMKTLKKLIPEPEKVVITWGNKIYYHKTGVITDLTSSAKGVEILENQDGEILRVEDHVGKLFGI